MSAFVFRSRARVALRAAGLSACAYLALALLTMPACSAGPQRTAADPAARIEVDASNVLQTTEHRMLTGTNVAGWEGQEGYACPALRDYQRQIGRTVVRLPGGSWGDGTQWNGNGVWKDGAVDPSRFIPVPYSEWSAPWGTWDIDYSGYDRSFLAVEGKPDQWHGNISVKYMHDFIKDVGSEAFVILNGGQGSPVDAAEWVKWAKKEGYPVRYWELGNELGGSWEVGHFLPDGSELNGYIFARRFEEFAEAVKAVDPEAKIGAMDWIEDVLAYRGDLLDFISIHSYPVTGTETLDEFFKKAFRPAGDHEGMRRLVEKYQPDRADQVDIGYSEWAVGTPEITGAQWHAIFVGEAFKAGMKFINQFTIFGLLPYKDGTVTPRGSYWAWWMWSNLMGDSMVAADVTGTDKVTVYATITDDGLSIMVINRSPDDQVDAQVAISGFDAGEVGQEVGLTHREYLWVAEDSYEPSWRLRPAASWSRYPAVRPVEAGAEFTVSLPPSSIMVYRLPPPGKTLGNPVGRPETTVAQEPRLLLVLPWEAYASDPIEGWVVALNGDSEEPYPLPLDAATITVEGPAKADRPAVRLAETAGRFTLTPTGPGEIIVTVASAGKTASRTMKLKASIPMPHVFWDFEGTQVPGNVDSDWLISVDSTIRANQSALRVNFDSSNQPVEKKSRVFGMDGMPDGIERSNVRGALMDIRTSDDFKCTDPDARIAIVMQSNINWWMVIGNLKVSDLSKEWQTLEFITEDPSHIKAMPGVFNLHMFLYTEGDLSGSICIDNVGLMIR